ncbi:MULTISPECIES: GNAT family N-acetyltransferase [Bacillus]|uniref:GNAT family N-acetyltransferase n=1 Tax=Bacillus pseudomycoides TaxID=64104 RepID=A0AAJ1Z3P0_9BACI|nr:MULTISPECIES: GNAT family N-acetyltransferase [Bacillus cereus group]EEM05325.1 GCN5-related N-acetyltransferase [Bacillus pseudomycoides]KFN15391.1 acetyltransferase domain protein [Bacillus pseudomycoides]MBJ8028556.1 GNAT family N-acetyltransferase [Bacillus cereus group sp. N21]MCR8858862.1 GNAT family N-acetyltransferase [Bacillus pseudomycoides]MDR4188307.1 GNAT family N-acetyltransferase [Bacillus pseudomycoides]
MNIQLKIITRDNWEEALKLQVSKKQTTFVPPVAVSLAKVYIKPDGENVEYIPLAIYDDDSMIGFIMHAFEPNTSDMYWINGFMIDEHHQRKGYGKTALAEMIKWITNEFTECKEIRLTVHKENIIAKRLYEGYGFKKLDYVYDEEQVYRLYV